MEVEYLCRCSYCKKLTEPADFVSKTHNVLTLTKRCIKCREYACRIVRNAKISKMIQKQKI